ncbi:MAG: class I SAM-dependent methyltransferase [Flavobacteriales bacterium]
MTIVHEPSQATEAFTRQSTGFDAIDAANPLIARMRRIVRKSAMRHYGPSETLLELNAGTGIDSFYFASNGLNVLATDAAPGMIIQLKTKQALNPQLKVEVEQCSFLDLHQLGDRKFKHVFSNFGGLNCTAELELVLKSMDALLLPGGTCALVIMPRFSPWEFAAAIKGNFKLAVRRWKKNGTPAHLEGVTFPCYYYSPSFVTKHLGKHFRVLEIRALSLVVPPPHMERFPANWPTLLKWLHALEERICNWWPFRNWGDHFLIILQKKA